MSSCKDPQFVARIRSENISLKKRSLKLKNWVEALLMEEQKI